MRRPILAAFLAVSAAAQTPPAPRFEVAAIKPSMPIAGLAQAGQLAFVGLKIDGARVDIGAFSLQQLVQMAYRIDGYQFVGPEWLAMTRFDIHAKMPEGATREQVPEMMQALLAERFKLAVRRERRELAAYALITAKDGPKLKEVPADVMPPERTPKGTLLYRIMADPPSGMQTVSLVNGRQIYETAKVNMRQLTRFLMRYTDAPVIDLTGLTGFYEAEFQVPVLPRPGLGRAGVMPPADEPSDPAGVSIFGSVQKIGLKLDHRKLPVDQIIVEHMEKTPTEN